MMRQTLMFCLVLLAAPSVGFAQPSGIRPGSAQPAHRPWRRGDYLPAEARAAIVADYGRHHLRRPPAGFHWVLAGEDYLLIADATGRIFDIVPAR